MLSKQTTAEQIDAWRAAESEHERLEFKEAKNQFNFQDLLEYCVALANERGGVLLLGANRPPRPGVGTRACFNVVKTTEALFNKLGFRVDIEAVQHPDGRVLVFHIPPRPIGHPYHLDGRYLMRSGESLVAMSPDQLKQIFGEHTPVINDPARQYDEVLATQILSKLDEHAVHKSSMQQLKTGLPDFVIRTDDEWYAIAGVRILQVSGRYILGGSDSRSFERPDNTAQQIDSYFLLDTQFGKHTNFPSYDALRRKAMGIGNCPRIGEY